jgi:hypothetical protein
VPSNEATEGFDGFYIETRDYPATAAFWKSLGFENRFETDHGSGQWAHPNGGPYLFIAEQHDRPLELQPILRVADASAFEPSGALDVVQPFTAQHWGVLQAIVRDPDGRPVSLEAPLPEGSDAPDIDQHHADKYG